MTLPTVDVILPFHNFDNYLSEALISVSKSNGVAVRIILVDDRRHPKKLLVVSDFPSLEVKDLVVIQGGGLGYANAMNLGRTEIKSNFVAIMNSDDLIAHDKLTLQVESLISSKADLCVGRLLKFSRNGNLPALSGEVDVANYDFKYLLLGAYGADATIVTTASMFSRIEFDEQRKSSDWATAFQYYPDLKIVGNAEAEYFYRIHTGQITQDPKHKKMNFEEIYPLWAELNAKLSLPSLNYTSAGVLAAPYERLKLDDLDLLSLRLWEAQYLKLFNDSAQRKDVKNLLKRRHCMLFIRKQPIAFNPFTMIVMITELLISKSRRTAPRW